MTLDYSDKQEGLASLKVSSQNVSDGTAFGVGYDFQAPANLSNSLIILWVKILNVRLDKSLFISVMDSNNNWVTSNDFGRHFAIEPDVWTRVAIDPVQFSEQAANFNLASVRTLWFGSYNQGQSFNQTFWLDAITLVGATSQHSATVDPTPQWQAALVILLLFLVTLPLGILTSRIFKLQDSPTTLASTINRLPVQIALGIAVQIMIFFLALVLWMNAAIVIGVWVLSIVLLLYTGRRSGWMLRLRGFRLRRPGIDAVGSVGTLLSLGFSIFLISDLVSRLGWPPPNDSFIHAMIVSLVVSNNRMPNSFSPISSIPLEFWRYPRGFYGVPSALTFSLGVYPSQSVMLFAAAMVALLPSLLYSTTFLRTRSPVWATLAFFSAFIFPGGAPSDGWVASHDLLFGNFLVSTYPSLTGNLLLLSMFAVIVLFDDFKPISIRRSRWIRPFVLLTVTIAITYYPYLLFALLYLLVRIPTTTNWRAITERIGKIQLSILVILAIGGFLYALSAARNYAISQLSLIPGIQFQVQQQYNPLTPGSEYLIYAILVSATIGLALILRFGARSFHNNLFSMEVFFLIMLAPHVASFLVSENQFSSALWMMVPDRSLILLYSLTFVMIPIYLSRLESALGHRPNSWLHPWKMSANRKVASKILILLVIFLVFSPMISAVTTYSPSAGRADILQTPRDGDYLVGAWIASHINSSALILNDLTLSGVALTSFRALHVVNDMQRLEDMYLYNSLSKDQMNLILGADFILQHPGEYSVVRQVMITYNLEYIYISNANRSVGFYGSGMRFAPALNWTMTQNELLAVYMNNPYLELVYQVGAAAVFRFKG